MDSVRQYIFQFPEHWIHIRPLAKALALSPTTVSTRVASLLRKGLLQEQRTGNLLQVRGNLDEPRFIQEKRVFNLESIYSSGLFAHLARAYPTETIVLFGSYSRGEDLSGSDIDIAVFSSEERNISLHAYEDSLKRTINLLAIDKRTVSRSFLTNVLNGIVLQGVVTI